MPRSGLILERPREGRREERTFLAITVPAIHKRGQLAGCPLGDHHAKAEALACGVRAFLAKPVSLATLERAIIIEILDGDSVPSD